MAKKRGGPGRFKARRIPIQYWLSLDANERRKLQSVLGLREKKHTGHKRRAREVSRLPALRAKKLFGHRPIPRSQLLWTFHPHLVLDALVPERKTLWRVAPRRFSGRRFGVSNFSFLDDRDGTIETLREIIRRECTDIDCRIDYQHKLIPDILPYLVLAVIFRSMYPFAVRGEMQQGVQRVFRALRLDRAMEITLGDTTTSPNIFAFPLQSLEPGALTSDDISQQVSRREKVQRDLVACVDDWLGALSPPFKLTDHARRELAASAGETLCNAERHSAAGTSGGWWITGFMARRESDAGVRHVCHIGVVSVGSTIAETLLASPPDNDRFWPLFDAYRKLHPTISPPLAATILSVQDGVSRLGRKPSETHGGLGMQDLISNVEMLGQVVGGSSSTVAILSGSSWLKFSQPYLSHYDGERRVQWFNRAQRPNDPPDPAAVSEVDFHFPGTLISIRFELDAAHLDTLLGGIGS